MCIVFACYGVNRRALCFITETEPTYNKCLFHLFFVPLLYEFVSVIIFPVFDYCNTPYPSELQYVSIDMASVLIGTIFSEEILSLEWKFHSV